MNKISYVNTQKSSSHPTAVGGVYEGIVKSFKNGLATVRVKQLECTYSEVRFLGNSTRGKLKKGDQVLCTFIDNELSTLYIIGAYSKSLDTFVGKEKYNALIDALISQIGITGAALTTFNALKQND